MKYLDFKISVEQIADQNYRVSVSSDEVGENHEPSTFPFDDAILDAKLAAVRNVLYTTGTRAIRQRKPTDSVEPDWGGDEVNRFGTELFDFLFPRENLSQLRKIIDVAGRAEDTGVRLKLRFGESASKLSAIPWEFLRDAGRREFIALDNRTTLVRYLDLAQRIEPLSGANPLKILGMVSNPIGDLNVDREKSLVEQSLNRLIDEGKVELGWVEGDTFRDIQSAVRKGDWHVFHYIGHAGFDEEKQEGHLLLGDGRGGSMQLAAKSLSRLIRVEKLRLILLNACEGATSDKGDLFSSTASVLVNDGIPAVLAMQYPITDTAAIELARTFYESIADGSPVDYAVADARINIDISHPDSLEWATPVLFMRSKDGQLFDVPKEEPQAAETPVQTPKDDGTPDGYDPNNVMVIDRRAFKKVVGGFNIDELRSMIDDLGFSHEDLPAQTQSALARELINYLKRRNQTQELVALLNADGKRQIDAVLGHKGPISFSG